MATAPSASRLADHFVNYLFDEYAGDNLHVRQVASWLGLLILGLRKLNVQWRQSNSRQLMLEHNGKRYKARYNHKIRPRGGIEFVEVAVAPGNPDVAIVRTIASLMDAGEFYDHPSL